MNTYLAERLYSKNVEKYAEQLQEALAKKRYAHTGCVTDIIPEDHLAHLAILRLFSQDFKTQKEVLAFVFIHINKLFQKLVYSNRYSIARDINNSIVNFYVDEIEDDLFEAMKKSRK